MIKMINIYGTLLKMFTHWQNYPLSALLFQRGVKHDFTLRGSWDFKPGKKTNMSMMVVYNIILYKRKHHYSVKEFTKVQVKI